MNDLGEAGAHLDGLDPPLLGDGVLDLEPLVVVFDLVADLERLSREGRVRFSDPPLGGEGRRLRRLREVARGHPRADPATQDVDLRRRSDRESSTNWPCSGLANQGGMVRSWVTLAIDFPHGRAWS